MTPQELNENIKQAMKNHDNIARDTYRLVLGDVKNFEISKQKTATEQDVNAMIKRLLKQTSETLEYAKKIEGDERVELLQERERILKEALPAQLEGAALRDRIENILAEIPDVSKKNIGQIMGQLTKETDGNFDKAGAGVYLNKVL